MKEIHIPKVTGFPHWYWLERRRGRSDVTSGQLIICDEGATTPWINRKRQNFITWVQVELTVATKSIEDITSEATKLLGIIQLNQGNHSTGREAAAAMAADNRLNELAIEAKCLNSLLMYRIKGALALLNSHICAYWGGICQEISDAPAEPMELKNSYMDEYLTCYSNLTTALERKKESCK